MVYGILMIHFLLLLVILMLTGSKMLRIEKTHLVLVFSLVIFLWLGLVKKQNFVSLSTTEDEYIVVGSCSTQLLWMKKMLKDYEIKGS